MPRYKFSEIAINITEKRIPTPEDKDLYVGLEHLDSGSLAVTRWGSPVEITGQKLVMSKGDLLFGRRNTYLKRAAIAPHDGLFSAHGMIFRPKTSVINPELFPFFISSEHFMEEAIRISVGSLSPTVNWGTLKDLEFDLPPIEEQSMLTEVLVAANEAKEAYKKLLSITEELVKSQFIEMFGDPVTNPMGWPIQELNAICDVRDGTHDSPSYIASGYPLVTSKNVVDGKLDLSNVNFISEADYIEINKRSKVDLGDIIMPMIGTIGKPLIITAEPSFAIKNVALIKFNKTETSNIYIQQLLSLASFLERNILAKSKGITQKFIALGDIRKLQIPIPTQNLQNNFELFVQQVDKSKFELQQTLDKLNATIKLLMQ